MSTPSITGAAAVDDYRADPGLATGVGPSAHGEVLHVRVAVVQQDPVGDLSLRAIQGRVAPSVGELEHDSSQDRRPLGA